MVLVKILISLIICYMGYKAFNSYFAGWFLSTFSVMINQNIGEE